MRKEIPERETNQERQAGQLTAEEVRELLEKDSTLKFYGLSVSRCVWDIASGKIPEEAIMGIIGGTRCKRKKDWEKVIETYKKWWGEESEKCEKILQRLIKERKIVQPRIYSSEEDDYSHNIADGCYVLAYSIEKFLLDAYGPDRARKFPSLYSDNPSERTSKKIIAGVLKDLGIKNQQLRREINFRFGFFR
ncbi:MAG: hypothetical protein ACPLKP_03455 [Microgenomates group bacterium]